MKTIITLIIFLLTSTLYGEVIYINEGECKYIDGDYICATDGKAIYDNKAKKFVFQQIKTKEKVVSSCYCRYMIADLQLPSSMPLKGYWLIKIDENGKSLIDNFGGSDGALDKCTNISKHHPACLSKL